MFRVRHSISPILLLLVIIHSRGMSQNFYHETTSAKDRAFGFGLQSSYPVAGFSVRMNIGDHAAVQGIIGVIGIATVSVRSLGLRGLYRFDELRSAEPYLFASVSTLEVSFTDLLSRTSTERFPGYGFGGGIEFASSRFPDVALNAEVGYGSLRHTSSAFQFSNIMYGAGFHYYFQR